MKLSLLELQMLNRGLDLKILSFAGLGGREMIELEKDYKKLKAKIEKAMQNA